MEKWRIRLRCIRPTYAYGFRRRPEAAADDKAAQRKLLPPATGFAQHVAEFEIAFDDLQDRRIAGGADRQLADILAVERRRRGGRAGPDHRAEFHAERQEFRHRDQLVERRAVDAHGVHVAADDVGQKPGIQHHLGGAEAERAAAMADIETQRRGAAPP